MASQTNLKNVAIYYAFLSSLNSAANGFDSTNVINDLNQYDIVVAGAGIEDPGHGDYANSTVIIPGLANSVELFGYVTIGDNGGAPETLAAIQGRIDNWQTLGAEGIFLDEAGFDFWPSGTDAAMRVRQNTIIDYAHGKSMKVFVNAWDPDDVFIKEATNPITVTSNDYYLLESYIFKDGSANDQLTTMSFANHEIKLAKVQAAQSSHGIKAIGVSTTGLDSGAYNQVDFDFLAVAAQLDGLDGIGWGTKNFSATGVDVAVMPYRPIQDQYNGLELEGSLLVDNPSESKSRLVLNIGTLNADYGNQIFTGI